MKLTTPRTTLILLVVYVITQIAVWYVSNQVAAFLLILQQLEYFVAIGLGGSIIIKNAWRTAFIRLLGCLSIFAVFNAVLLLFWYLNVHLNPEINWRLTGNSSEVDPNYAIIYLPLINFMLSALILIGCYLTRIGTKKSCDTCVSKRSTFDPF